VQTADARLTRMSEGFQVRVRRFDANPIIVPEMDRRMGRNIGGPSLIRVPPWLPNALGRYYLYFADHKGDYIRLAIADDLAGPWKTHVPGSLQLAESGFPMTLAECNIAYTNQYGVFGDDLPHIASPDVHVDHANRQIRMYFHGMLGDGNQVTRVGVSDDGIRFKVNPDSLGSSYFRVFRYRDWHYAVVMPGLFVRSRDGLRDFQPGPTLFDRTMRHSAVLLAGDTLRVFYSNAGDSPERILCRTIDLSPDWMDWQTSEAHTVVEPTMDYEGADVAMAASVRGASRKRVRQLRDPAIFEGDGRTYLLYAIAGEGGIAIAELRFGDA